MRKVAEHVYALDGLKLGRSYLIADRDALTLVDTSSPSAAARIIAAIEAIGRRPEELRTIVATHYHYDHVGNVASLTERSGAHLFAHEGDVPYIEAKEPWPDKRGPICKRLVRWPEQEALPVQRSLREGDILPAAGGLHVLHTPGHTPGSLSLFAPAIGVMFVGDAFQNTAGLRTPIVAHDMDQARTSIRRLSEYDFDHALPGHGQPVLSRAGEKLREWIRRW